MSEQIVEFVPPKSDPIPIPTTQRDLEGYPIIQKNNYMRIRQNTPLFTKHGIPIRTEPAIKFNLNPNFKFP